MACYLLVYRSLRSPGDILCHAVPRLDGAPWVHRIDTKLPGHVRRLAEMVR